MSAHNLFIGDPEFCPECGTILPLPGSAETVTCGRCEQKVDVKRDPEFCPECGMILPLPGSAETVTCRCCGHKVDVKKFDGITVTYEIRFNNKEKYQRKKKEDQRKKKDEGQKSIGPLVDRDCSKCGHQGMAYTTMQTRSADEGQTVFYACPQCDHREHEHS